ncbi:50S ribosomal protein L11 methyltransferase [Lapidilactobacillus mulanensis]|nr:50S ribosomal protein L11 methyltransferase [Lapidilactobacillus mulanensis]
MNWLQVKLIVAVADVEIIANVLEELGSGGVQISDDPQFDSDISAGQEAVIAFLPEEIDQQDFLSQLQQRIQLLLTENLFETTPRLLTKTVSESNWTNTWQDHYQPVRVTRYVTVVPEWIDYSTQREDEILVKLNPGKSFGTGMHPTTQLAISCLELTMRGNERVFDVGTGSGILSIVADKFGAQSIIATELDEAALGFTQENFELNQVEQKIKLLAGSLLSPIDTQADLIVANMLPEALIPLLPQLDQHLLPNGQVILTGIIKAQATKIKAEIQAQGFLIDLTLHSEQWVCYRLKRQSESV